MMNSILGHLNRATSRSPLEITQQQRAVEGALRALSQGDGHRVAAAAPGDVHRHTLAHAQLREAYMARRGENDHLSRLQRIEADLANLDAPLQRLRELAIAGASEILGDEDRALLRQEAEQLIGSMESTARRLSEGGALGDTLGKSEESPFQLQTSELEALGTSLSRLFQFQGEDLAPERELVIILDVSNSNVHARDALKADLFATIEGLTVADDRPLRVAVIGTELTNTPGTLTIVAQQESPLLTVSGDEGAEGRERLSDFFDGLTFGVGQTQIDDAIRSADELLVRDEEVQQQVIVIASSGGEGTAQIKAEAASAARAFSAGDPRRNLSAIGTTRTPVGVESTPSTYFQNWLVPAGGGNSETYVRGELHFEEIFRDVSSRAGEINSIDLSSGLRAQESLQSIDQAIARVGGARAEIGAMWWRHETRRRVHGRGVGVLSQRLAALSAADIAAEVSQLKQAQGGLESVAKVRAAQQSLYGETLLALLG